MCSNDNNGRRIFYRLLYIEFFLGNFCLVQNIAYLAALNPLYVKGRKFNCNPGIQSKNLG